jgi:flagella basal body P-ring formation protein FlgA
LEFPVSGLRATPWGAIWNGSLRYAANRRQPVWAKVKASVSGERVVAATDLAALHRVYAAQLRLETAEMFPTEAPVRSIEAVGGRVLRRAVPAGTPLHESWFDAPRDIERGDKVRVEVRCGGALIEIETEAQASGSAGQIIPLRNEASKKSFRATVEGKGRASLGL